MVFLKVSIFFLLPFHCCIALTTTTSNIQDNLSFSYKSVLNCKKNEYYDLDYFSCVNCDNGNYLVPSDDHFGCKCHPQSIPEVLYDSTLRQPICREKCKNCSITKLPKCQLKYISPQINGASRKFVQVIYDDSRNCTCDLKFNSLYENFCVSNGLLKDFAGYNIFSHRTIYENLKFIAFFCKTLRNTTACNHLANLCVASFYNLDKNSPCSHFFVSQASDAAAYGGEELANVRPFLFYRKGKEMLQELEKTIDYYYSLEKGIQRSSLNFYSTSYTMDGKLHRMDTIAPNHLNFCQKNIISNYNKFNFAKNYVSSCKLSLDALIGLAKSPQQNTFTNIFLNFTIDNMKYLQPVPILIRNAFPNNKDNKRDDWQLVKRFSFIDGLPGTPIGPINRAFYEDSNKLKNLKSIRYIDYFEIRTTIKEDNKIQTPVIILHYKNIEIFGNSSLDKGYEFIFKVTFEKHHNLDFCIEVILPILVAIGFAFALLRTFNFKTRQNNEFYDFSALLQFALYLISNCANAFFAVAFFICFYVFFVNATQDTVKLLVPVEEQNLVEVLIWTACGLKGIYLTFHFWRIAHIDIFFIDWERPKGFDAHLTIRSNLDTPSVCSSARSTVCDAVSAWRNYFVANEWINISTKRKTSVLTQSILILSVMKFLEMEFPNEFKDKTLTLAISLFVYAILYIGQIIFIFIVLDRIFGNPLQQFVDICSTANISVFILLHDSYGFYIHGRSPHGFSDTDMSSMIIQLQRESQNMCGKRGLLTGSDHQTYTILAPTHLRIYYYKLLTPFQKACSFRTQIHFEEEFVSHKGPEYSVEKTALAYSSVNRFFCAFIDHAIKDLDYIIKERNLIEILLDCEFENYLSENKGTFYIDNGHSFDKVLLYGNDAQQFLFQIMFFCSILVITENLVASAFATSFLYMIFQLLFRRIVKNNVALKTLIDKRFLI